MGEVLEAVIRDLGKPPYADGAPQLEINLPAEHAVGQAFVQSERTSITLRVAGKDYAGGVLANKPDHKIVWFSPTLTGPGGERMTLGRVLTDAGFSANDRVRLVVMGTIVEVQAAV